MALLLLVDDEPMMREVFRPVFESDGHTVRTAESAEAALALAAAERPDLAVLDQMLPGGMDGIQLGAQLRRLYPELPLVVLTAYGSERAHVRALDSGVDEFIDKVAPRDVLLARVRALLRRSAGAAAGAAPAAEPLLKLGRLQVDLRLRLVLEAGKEPVRLTRTEAEFLRLLASERGRVFGYAELGAALYGEGYQFDPRLLRTHAYNLKGKLGAAGALVCNERQNGYRLLA